MGLQSGSSVGNERTHEKLQDVREFLMHDSPAGGDPSQALAQSLLLSEALLGRAPADFLGRTPTESLARIVKEVYSFYYDFLQSGSPLRVDVRTILLPASKRPSTIILTAIADRPFLVDTLFEVLRSKQLHHRVLLHPIIRHEDQRLTSVTYLELPEIEDANLIQELIQEITARFTVATAITDDFGSSVKEVEGAISTLRDRNSSIIAPEVERKEIREFLRWLVDGGFVFMGVQNWEALGDTQKPHCTPGSALGLFRSPCLGWESFTAQLPEFISSFLGQKLALSFSKLPVESPIHRFTRLDLVLVKLPGLDGTGPRVLALAGLLTSKAMSHEAASVPIIRRKLQNILQLEGLLPNSHSYKEFLSIANSIPKGELLQLSVEQLRDDIHSIMGIVGRSELRIRVFPDAYGQFLSALVALPQDRFSATAREKIRLKLEQRCGSSRASSEYHVTTSDLPLVLLHYLLPMPSGAAPHIIIADLEREVSEIVVTWDDRVRVEFAGPLGDHRMQRTASHYAATFPETYKAATTPEQGAQDIRLLEALSPETPLQMTLAPAAGSSDNRYTLSLYKQGDDLTLSAILPFLENVGLNILQEWVTPLTLRSGANAAIYKMLVRHRLGQPLDLGRVESVLIPGLKLVLGGEADNDRLNELMLCAGLHYRQIAILRALTSYLWQIKATTSLQALVVAMVDNPSVSALIVEYFSRKFDPGFAEDREHRKAALDETRTSIERELRAVSQLAHDRSLRQMLNVIDATVRTNFYRIQNECRIALKIESKRIERMPNPRPMFEIFVTAPDFEGIHLRGGKVARGGIRWSDRVDDFRTEVLGLMKTQMVKNAIIVPVGAKGGFVLKHRPAEAKLLNATVKECYRRYIRSLLEVTDNRVDGATVHPPATVIYDEPDPYFVVAADRGTAALSDVANELAMSEFNFWLGDAFASGGSNGYDHKKLAITARGVWETVQRHFREIGIDTDTQDFTVVGIGDMSGDVFGNGVLLSRRVRLIAAFDHRHIFIDPNPVAETSFEERTRLFHLPQSSWKDYNAALISTGGGVFDRSMKEIPISSEAREALGIEATVLSGQELIRSILRAPVDLLWNGGIGTYVKAAEEDNIFVGDRANDEVRIDARELRVKVVGEGGNLGFTQRARIEYSRIGGHINTDAIDNSGGVNTSDIEVNGKILLSAPVARGALSLAERNTLLMSLADSVCDQVLYRNRAQSLAISVGVKRSRKNIGYLKTFIHSLERTGLLDRRGEYLPDDTELEHRIEMKAGLTRPELSVLVGYAKMSLFQTIMGSTLPEDPYLQRYLLEYFPAVVSSRYQADILEHPLRREIIATQLANFCVERMGISFVFRSANELGVPQETILKCFVAADAIIRGEERTQELEGLDRPSSTRQHLTTVMRLSSSIDQMVRWFVDHRYDQYPAGEIVDRFSSAYDQLVSATESLTTAVERNRLREATRQLVVAGASRSLAQAVAAFPYSTVYLDIVEVASLCKVSAVEVAKLVSHLYLALHVRPILEQAAEFEPSDRWQLTAMRTLIADVRRAVAKLTAVVIQQCGSTDLTDLENFIAKRREMIERFEATYQECTGRALDVPTLLVLTNHLFALSRL